MFEKEKDKKIRPSTGIVNNNLSRREEKIRENSKHLGIGYNDLDEISSINPITNEGVEKQQGNDSHCNESNERYSSNIKLKKKSTEMNHLNQVNQVNYISISGNNNMINNSNYSNLVNTKKQNIKGLILNQQETRNYKQQQGNNNNVFLPNANLYNRPVTSLVKSKSKGKTASYGIGNQHLQKRPLTNKNFQRNTTFNKARLDSGRGQFYNPYIYLNNQNSQQLNNLNYQNQLYYETQIKNGSSIEKDIHYNEKNISDKEYKNCFINIVGLINKFSSSLSENENIHLCCKNLNLIKKKDLLGNLQIKEKNQLLGKNKNNRIDYPERFKGIIYKKELMDKKLFSSLQIKTNHFKDNGFKTENYSLETVSIFFVIFSMKNRVF